MIGSGHMLVLRPEKVEGDQSTMFEGIRSLIMMESFESLDELFGGCVT